THPEAQPLGWEGFAALAQGSEVPIYALGGMAPDRLETAWRYGAHGIAMLRGSWQSV
ncbi:MAG: thiamine phosphate synthase, partial [Betaproteobacteria bacterium]|nr:thiamine phosphate synthase [Betaproteobacteria bacterium]